MASSHFCFGFIMIYSCIQEVMAPATLFSQLNLQLTIIQCHSYQYLRIEVRHEFSDPLNRITEQVAGLKLMKL